MTGFQRAVVAITDEDWYGYFRPENRCSVIDEVNFWRPLAQQHFHALAPGDPFFLRRKSPWNAIAGFGFFATQQSLPIYLAWEVFGGKNGDSSFAGFLGRITKYRERLSASGTKRTDPLSCIVLRDVVFLPEEQWIPWGSAEEWSKNIVAFKSYDLAAGAGRILAGMLTNLHPQSVPDFAPEFSPIDSDERLLATRMVSVREGQSTFRLRLLGAYGGRCAVTGEHAWPVLDSAHIQPYLGPQSNHVQNGLILRTDLHRLFDGGYLKISPEYRLEVSRRLKDEFDNGEAYYAMQGRELIVPSEPKLRPSREALAWHAKYCFQ